MRSIWSRGPRLVFLFLAVVTASAACQVARQDAATRWTARAPIALSDTVRVRVAGRILSVPLEEYVLGSALSEVSPVGESSDVAARIFAVQAVIARTYAVAHLDRHRAEGFDLCDQTHCQLYQPVRIQSSAFTPIAREAVDATRGQVLAYAGRPAQALYHADCGGHTAASETVWGGAVPYLTGAVDDVPEITHRRWTFGPSIDELRLALNAEDQSRVGATLTSVRVVARDVSGRATDIELRGDATRRLSGERLRTIVNERFGPRAILSTRFDVSTSSRQVSFEGTGFGHGVGLCQVGAAARARRGESLEAILAAYFRGAELREAQGAAVRSSPIEPAAASVSFRPNPFPAAR